SGPAHGPERKRRLVAYRAASACTGSGVRINEKGPSELPKGLSPNPSPGPLSPEKKSFLFRSTCLAAAHNVTLGTLLLFLGLLLLRRGLLLRLALLLRLLGLLLCRHAYLLLEVRTFPFRPSPRREFLPTSTTAASI